MDIAALASISKYTELRQSVSTAVARLAMDQSESQSQDLLRMMETSVNPDVGVNIDIRV